MQEIDKLAQTLQVGDIAGTMPDSMEQIIDVLEVELSRNHVERPRLLACKLALAQGWAMGGRQHYIPTPKRVGELMRNDSLIRDYFSGVSAGDLCRKYSLSQASVSRIINNHRL